MPAVARELRPRSGTDTAPVRVYSVKAADDEADAMNTAWDEAPDFIGPCAKSTMSYNEIDDLTGLYEVTISYAERSRDRESYEINYSLDYQAKALQINYSLSTIWASDDAPDFNQAINVVSDNGTLKIEGHSREVPPDTIKLGYWIPATDAGAAYIDDLEQLCGCVSSASMTLFGTTYPAGELLLSRASAAFQNADQFGISLGFSRIPNSTGVTIGEIVVPAMDGHDLLWLLYEEARDTTAKSPTKKARAGYIERIWPRANLNAIFI